MAILTVSLQRTTVGNEITGTVSIAVKATGAVLDSYAESFPVGTADDYVLNMILNQTKRMMRTLAMRQLPASLSFDVDSGQIRLRRLFDL